VPGLPLFPSAPAYNPPRVVSGRQPPARSEPGLWHALAPTFQSPTSGISYHKSRDASTHFAAQEQHYWTISLLADLFWGWGEEPFLQVWDLDSGEQIACKLEIGSPSVTTCGRRLSARCTIIIEGSIRTGRIAGCPAGSTCPSCSVKTEAPGGTRGCRTKQ